MSNTFCNIKNLIIVLKIILLIYIDPILKIVQLHLDNLDQNQPNESFLKACVR